MGSYCGQELSIGHEKQLSYNLIKMISGFKRISPVLSGRALAKRKVKTLFSPAIGKGTLQRTLQY